MDFKIKKLDNVKFSFKELEAYYHEIKRNYQKLKWTPPGEMSSQAYSWAIQTKLQDPTQPCGPYHWPGEDTSTFNNRYDTPTELIFGFGEKIISVFPEVKQTNITVHSPGTIIEFHIDKELELEDHFKIHFPIETNEDSVFQYEDEEFHLEAGSAYLVNTGILHGTNNRGITERAHLIFKIPASKVSEILNTAYEI